MVELAVNCWNWSNLAAGRRDYRRINSKVLSKNKACWDARAINDPDYKALHLVVDDASTLICLPRARSASLFEDRRVFSRSRVEDRI